MLEGDLGTKTRQDLPSWVPDWSAPVSNEDRLFCHGLYNASYGTLVKRVPVSHPRFIELSSLNTFTSQVLAVGAVMLTVEEPDVSVIREWLSLLQRYRGISATGGFSRTLCADLVYRRARPGYDEENFIGNYNRLEDAEVTKVAVWFSHAHLEALRKEHKDSPERLAHVESDELSNLLSNMIGDSDTSVSADEAINIKFAVRTATTKRRFFLAAGGRMGLGPAKIRADDEIHILEGGRIPFILRPSGRHSVFSNVEDERSVHELIGDCYVNGLMDGDALKDWTASDWERKRNKIYLM